MTFLDFELPVDGLHIRQLVYATMRSQAIEKGLEDPEAHFAKRIGCLIPVYPAIEVRLGKHFNAVFLIEVQ